MRVACRNEGLLAQFCAKITRVDICDDLTCVLGCAQESAGDFLETEPLWTSYVDNIVYWRAQCDIDQRGSNVVRQDGLDVGRRHANRLPIGWELSDDRPYELKELRSADDCIGYSRRRVLVLPLGFWATRCKDPDGS